MPRLARLDAPGVRHHVMGRGIERRKIFLNDTDRNDFIGRQHWLRLVPGKICLGFDAVKGRWPISGYSVTVNLSTRSNRILMILLKRIYGCPDRE